MPDARASAIAMYGPRGVCLHDGGLIVADSGNHRLLLWQSLPTQHHAPADVVIGQNTFTSEAPGLLHLPTGVAVVGGRLVVCDAWHHRVLVWNRVPTENNAAPDSVIGQEDLGGVTENRGGPPIRGSLYWPYGVGFNAHWFCIADTGNRRVLVWRGVPEPGQTPEGVIGQAGFERGEENRGEGVGPRSFRWPHGVCIHNGTLFIADAGNHRVLVWNERSGGVEGAMAGEPASHAIGQADLFGAREWPYGPQGCGALRFPYAIGRMSERELAIADTANNRVLLLDADAAAASNVGAASVLGQADFDGSGENRWERVDPTTLCWPYGVSCQDGMIAIADSGNNRVMVWEREPRLADPGEAGDGRA
ncbi:MAG: NHL repeat-containing protein [Planctomycetota bacterium]|nr:NHL repeat-containing protein [Planctomycetota bacterium]